MMNRYLKCLIGVHLTVQARLPHVSARSPFIFRSFSTSPNLTCTHNISKQISKIIHIIYDNKKPPFECLLRLDCMLKLQVTWMKFKQQNQMA